MECARSASRQLAPPCFNRYSFSSVSSLFFTHVCVTCPHGLYCCAVRTMRKHRDHGARIISESFGEFKLCLMVRFSFLMLFLCVAKAQGKARGKDDHPLLSFKVKKNHRFAWRGARGSVLPICVTFPLRLKHDQQIDQEQTAMTFRTMFAATRMTVPCA